MTKPVKSSEFADQIAALPMRVGKAGELRILMVTSRGTGRWVIPKGWTMDSRAPWKAAEIEALEEAGAEGRIGTSVLCTYHYDKWISEDRAQSQEDLERAPRQNPSLVQPKGRGPSRARARTQRIPVGAVQKARQLPGCP